MIESYHSTARKGHTEAYERGYERIFGNKKRNPARDQIPGQWSEKWKSGNKYIMRHKITGEERKVELDLGAIKRGDTLQPIGKDKNKFLEKYGYLPNEDKSETDKCLLRKGNINLKEFERRNFERSNSRG